MAVTIVTPVDGFLHKFNVAGSKAAWLASRDQFPNFGTPNNFRRKRAIRLKFGKYIEDGPSLRTHHKATPNSAWAGSHDLISKFLSP